MYIKSLCSINKRAWQCAVFSVKLQEKLNWKNAQVLLKNLCIKDKANFTEILQHYPA
jgi:hypothetical protein